MTTAVNTRTLKDRLSAYLRRAEQGERIVVMRGQRAVAVLVPFDDSEELDQDARLRQLAARDIVILPDTRFEHAFTGPRISSRERSAADMVVEDRR